MKKKLEIPSSVIDALNAIFDNWEECRKYSTADSERREYILQSLKKMENPTDEETNLISTLKSANETATVMRAALEKKKPELMGNFRSEFSKWLLGKYLYNRRHQYYIRIFSVEMRSEEDGCMVIGGPTIIEERESKDITRFDNKDSEFNIFSLRYFNAWSHQTEFERFMSEYEECELSDIIDAVENNKKAWIERYDNMKASIEKLVNIST